MSWISNITGKKDNPPSSPPIPDDPSTSKTVPSVSSWQNFDPSGLERAAKAAKDLEKSKNAKEALDLARIQEQTKQNEYLVKIRENEAYKEKLNIDKVRIQEEEKRKTINSETEQYKKRANYNDELSRRRQQDQLAQQDKMNDKILAKQEESVKKQEAMRKSTIDYKANLKKERELEVMKAKITAQGKLRRETHDLELDSIRTKLSEYRKTFIETVKTSSDIIGSGFQSLINDPYKISLLCGTILGMSLGLKSIKAGVDISSNFIQSRLGKPSLIRETSRFNSKEFFKQSYSRLLKFSGYQNNNILNGIYFNKSIEEQLVRISISSINTKKNNGYYRNLLFYGPPGTGKTLFAKNMAHAIGMDYAIMTGGDISPLGKDAVTSIHNVFKWANVSKKGLLLFIDESDAFLKKRNKEQISEDMRNALNAFLYNTGESSKNFMLVLATNQPDQLDRAISDRIDELVEFILPQLDERRRIFKYYFTKFILDEKNIKIEPNLQNNYDNLLESISEKTDGLSGREISKIVISWQASAFASFDGTLTEKMILDRTIEMSQQHKVKQLWEEHGSIKPDYLNV